jgi:tetratricopeptide (TPR) repeat protein
MSIQSVACPQCHTTLRSQRPVAPQEMVRCPQCGNHFLAGTSSVAAPTLSSGASPLFNKAFAKVLIPAAAAAFVLGIATVVGVYLLVRPHPSAVSIVDPERERQFAEDKRRLEEQTQELAQEREKLAEEKRQREFSHFMLDGKKYLANKQYDEAVTAFNGALSVYPGDPDAKEGFNLAQKGKLATTAGNTDNDKRKADYAQFMAQGKEAMTAKQYALAGKLFESALVVLPGDDAARTALANAKTELSKDESEKKKLSDYQTFLDAGNAALKAGRYTDAIREFIAAQRILPGDTAAARGQADAEKQLSALQNAEDRKKEFTRLMDKANDSLRDKKYDAAIDNATAAQRVLPDDPSSQRLIDTAKKAKDDARLEFNRLMAAAQVAMNAQQLQQAQQLNALALLLYPTDLAALKLQQDLQLLLANLQNVQAGQQAAYAILMTLGIQEMQARHFNHAARAFVEALRLVPGDPAATQGLADAQRNIAAIDVVRNADYDRLMTIGADALSRKLYRDAIVAYKEALKAVPDNPNAQVGLQKATYLRGMTDGEKAMLHKKFGDAVVLFKEALDAVPGDGPAKEQLRSARFQHAVQDGAVAMKEKRFGDAVPLYEEALKEKPLDPTLKELLRQAKFGRAMSDGLTAMQNKKYNDAISSFQDALRERPNDPTAQKLLGQARLMKN